MKNINKKLISGLLIILSAITVCSCSSRSKAMESLEGKDGLFAIIDTDKGEVALELFYKDTPLTVINFVALAEGKMDVAKGKPFYDGLKFHRVISLANGDEQDFMIQGGDPRGNGQGGPGYKFEDEFVEKLTFKEPGMLAMANSGKNTNGSQFFITIAPTEWLNYRHTIFGKVVFGQEVVNKILQNDKIKSVKIVRNGEEAKDFKADQKTFDEKRKAIKEEQFAKMTEGFTKTSENLYFYIDEEGTGNPVGKDKEVEVEYAGFLLDGTLFDCTQAFHPQGHEALSFVVNSGNMIQGFDIMVSQMKLNEVRTIVIPPELAYGEDGIPQAGIMPNSYICFKIKLTKIN